MCRVVRYTHSKRKSLRFLVYVRRAVRAEVMSAAALLHLLKAQSKQAIDDFLCACATEREQLKGPGAARIAELAASLSITAAEATQLQRAGAELVNEAVLWRVASAEQVGSFLVDLPETAEAGQLAAEDLLV